MKNAFKEVIYEDLINKFLKKYIYPFNITCIINDIVFNRCSIITVNGIDYVIRLLKNNNENWDFININIHGIKRKIYVSKVKFLMYDGGIACYEKN